LFRGTGALGIGFGLIFHDIQLSEPFFEVVKPMQVIKKLIRCPPFILG
jgi:hypothetical protein